MDLIMYVADYLRTYRVSKDWSMNEASRQAGVSIHAMRQFEYKHIVSINTLSMLCKPHGLLLSSVFSFAEIALHIGLKKAYASEAPHLIEFVGKHPKCTRKARLASSRTAVQGIQE